MNMFFLVINFQKRLPSSFDGNYEIISSGNIKNYDTNIYEKVLINDLKFSSNPKITSLGFVNKFNLLFKILLLKVITHQIIKTNLVQKIMDLFL